jgi:hypothetical protein
VDGDVRTMIGGDSVSAVKGDAVHGVTGKMTLKVGGGLQLKGDGAKDMKIDGKANLQFGDTLLISGQADITIESATRLIFQVGDNQIIITNDHISVIAKNGNLYSYAEKTIHDFAVETAKVQPPWEPGAEKPPEA